MELFGKYELIRRIGSGGMAEVFLARTAVAQNLAKQLVIKKIHPAFARSRQFVSMFVDEAKIALGLNHPNIVQVFDFGQISDTYFLAMEYVEGVDLLRLVQESIKQEKPIPFGIAAYLVQQMAKGLDYAHRKTDDFGEPLGIVHRDISPQNVLVSWDGSVKIVDFGIARARNVHEEEGVVKGKFAYMSPEQARGDAVDRRADVFSAGVVLFELTCLRPMFPGKGKEVLDKVKSGAVPRPREINRAIPESLEQIILQAVAFHREDRFQTGRDFQNALGRFLYETAASPDEMVESGELARFVAQTLPERRDRAVVRPPTAPVPAEVLAAAKAAFAARAGQETTGVADTGVSADTQPRAIRRPALRERKQVFVLEAQISGVPSLERRVGKEAAARVVADFVTMAQDIAFKHEAHVDRVESNRFSMVVGLPVASENDAARMLRLALALVESLDAIGHDVEPELRLAVGIQKGAALVTRKDGGRFEYELGAETYGIARRLAVEAHGADILCGGAVYRVARADWNFEELATIEIDESEVPPEADESPDRRRAVVYRLRGPKERAQRLRERTRTGDELIGRDLEIKALADAYRDVRVSERLRVIALVGEAGIGKRSVLATLLDTIPKSESVILRAAARATGAFTPFALVADLARDLLGLPEAADGREVRRRLETTVRDRRAVPRPPAELDALVEAVTTLLTPATADTPVIDTGERRNRIVHAITGIAKLLAGDQILVVVCEDLQWADDHSLELVGDIASMEIRRGVLIVLTSRPDARVLAAARAAGADVITLDELGETERIELVMRRFAPDDDAGELARELVARAGGNPFFLCEMIDSLIDREVLVAEPSGLLRWVKRDAAIAVPSSVEALLSTRIDQLPGRQKQALLCASVIGRRMNAALLEEVFGGPVREVIAALIERGLLRPDGSGFEFSNELLMAVAYRMLPNEERLGLHERVAQAIASGAGYRTGYDDAAVGRHWEMAGRIGEAADSYLAAAAHGVDIGGNSEAFRLLTRVLRLVPEGDHARRFAARQLREEILRRLARRTQQQREIGELRREAEALGTPDKLALVHARMAQFAIDMGDIDAARKAAEPSLEHAVAAGSSLAQAEALRLQSAIESVAGDGEAAIELADRALALCGNDREGHFQRARILNNRGTTLWNMSRLKESIEAYAEALVIYRMLKMPRLEARSLNNMGVVFSAMGEVEEALAHYKSSLKLDQRLGDRANVALKLGNIGQTYADLGDLERGEKYLNKALALAEANDDRASQADVLISLGQVELSRGAPERSAAYLERGLALCRTTKNRYQEIRALVYLSLALVDGKRDLERAVELATLATSMARKMPMPMGEIYSLAAHGYALTALGRADEGCVLTARAAELQRRAEQPEGSEHILYLHAVVAGAAGRADEAAAAIRAARAEVETKAGRLGDHRLRDSYLGSRIPREIAERWRRER